MYVFSSTTGGRTRVRTPGIPSKCWSRVGIIELIPKSTQNPYRWYYLCLYADQRKLIDDKHVFKWVDEAFTKEIQQLDFQVRMLEEKVQVLKPTISSESPKITPKIIILGGSLIPFVIVVLGLWMYKS
ncbi:hypothetical protein N665_0041s0021 [Sinapis alba]|nr:hypothetical protein N665_0041s0021 [Sinapis alba]